jgi:hypothetical protein
LGENATARTGFTRPTFDQRIHIPLQYRIRKYISTLTQEREWHTTCLIAEDVDATILMTTSYVSAISRLLDMRSACAEGKGSLGNYYPVNTKAETALGFEISNLVAVSIQIPHFDVTIIGSPSKILSILRQGNCPDLGFPNTGCMHVSGEKNGAVIQMQFMPEIFASSTQLPSTNDQVFISPPKPTLAARSSFPLVTT